MSDRTCTNCKHVFKYPSILKKHLQTSIHCLKSDEDISNLFNNSNNTCNICNKNFIRKDNYNRHINSCTNNLVILTKPIKPKKHNRNINTQININNTNNTNNTNNVTINNNLVVIQHIYPFGFEKLPNISKEEMKKLLLSGDKGVIEIIKLVYEQDENKNFYKINLKNNNISYLNDKYKLDICQENEMKDTLFKNCISLPNDMLVICKDILSTQEILYINFHNKSITEKIKEEIYDNGLKNIINTQLIYNSKSTKQNIDKYLTILNNNHEIKEEAINNLNNVKTITQNTYNEFMPHLSLEKINKKLGNPITEPELSNAVTHNDFCMKKFEDTKYKKYWDKRKQDENKLVMSLKEKKIGDIVELDNRINKINKKLNKMEYIHKDITFNQDLDKVEIASDYEINNISNTNNTLDNIINDIANMSDLQVFDL